MAVPKLFLLLAFSLAHADSQSTFSEVRSTKAIITYSDVHYTPSMMILGKENGSIVRCPHSKPNTCEEFHTADAGVHAILVHGEFLFAGLESGNMLRCSWARRHSCQEFHEAGSEVTGLAVMAGHIYASLHDGTLLQCNMNTAHSCRTFADLGKPITSLTASDDSIYVGSAQRRIDRCDSVGKCSLFCQYGGTAVTGLAVVGKKVYGLRHGGFIGKGDGTYKICESFEVSGGGYAGMAAYNGKLFLVKKDIDIRINMPGNKGNTTFFALHRGVHSISFAYGTYALQDKYLKESENCLWKSVIRCPPTVFYYEVHRRSLLEVFVRGGRLLDSQGAAVDTSDADEVHGLKAAIFVMGPDGQILLSKVHSTGLLHASSLLAGSPVSGAGLMQVEQGRIKRIVACSSHYRPDEQLNEQVKMSLRAKGYTDPIDSELCTYSDQTCRPNDLMLDGGVY